MKLYSSFRIVSILAYCFIILTGEFIGMPLIFVIAGDLFDLGTKMQASAIFAFIGLITIAILNLFSKTGWTFFIEVISFVFLLLPLIVRLTSMPISLFNYGEFIFPAGIFIIFYLLSLFFSYRILSKIEKNYL
jgi:hypothetical protein